ncbi:MAG: aspartate kinase [Saprospiraceae bacterium]
MQVFKFGGTSVGSPERMREVAELIDDNQPKIVVLSAVSGTTNKLVALAGCLLRGDREEATERLQALKTEYTAFIKELLVSEADRKDGFKVLDEVLLTLKACFSTEFTSVQEKIVLAQGELLSTGLFLILLKSQGISSEMLPALDFMRIDEYNEPDLALIQFLLQQVMETTAPAAYYITQGYICLNANSEIDNLQRGGSDYTATLLGAALPATEVQIWTDIDGLHNNDPRVVEGTFPLRNVSYREAAELAYFGAKILHPTCVIPAEKAGVPIRLKNTMSPSAPGTLISAQSSNRAIAAIAAKDNIAAIKIRSGRMFNAYGFLRRIFEVFEQFRTPIDMITTSEVAVSLTIDNLTYLDAIIGALEPFGEVEYQLDQTIICIVGDRLHQQVGVTKKIFSALEEVPLRMVSYGGSNNNISILVHQDYKKQVLQKLQTHLFVSQTAEMC